jgi:hypothetical protein
MEGTSTWQGDGHQSKSKEWLQSLLIDWCAVCYVFNLSFDFVGHTVAVYNSQHLNQHVRVSMLSLPNSGGMTQGPQRVPQRRTSQIS